MASVAAPAVTRVPESAREYARRVRAALGDAVADMRLFGSYARGDATDGSDIDVLVVLRSRDHHARRVAYDLSADLSFELGITLSPVVFDAPTWHKYQQQERPLARAIDREGIAL